MPATVQPLDPDSEKGREVAERLTEVLAHIRVEIEEQEAAAQRAKQAA